MNTKNQNIHRIFIPIVLTLALGSCAPFSPLIQQNPPAAPPILISWDMDEPDSIILRFSTGVKPPTDGEPLWFTEPFFPGSLLPETGDAYPNQWRYGFSHSVPNPGQEIELSGIMEDDKGGRLHFTVPVFGINANLPNMIINEIRGVHSATRPEALEILILAPGNTGGATIIIGHPGNPLHSLQLPSIDVEEQNFIVVHFRAQETALTGLHGNYGNPPPGSPVLENVHNVYLPGGLSATAELILLARDPRAIRFLDGIFYSNKTDNPQDRYRGFGTKAAWEKAQFLGDTGLWFVDENPEVPREVNPGDFPTSTGMTTTRTLNRWDFDSDNPHPGAQGWYISATGQGSIGLPNTGIVHEQ